MGEPAVAAAYFKDVEVRFSAGEMMDDTPGGLFSQMPFVTTGVHGVDPGKLNQFLIGVQAAFERPDLDIFLLKENFSQPGMALNLNIG